MRVTRVLSVGNLVERKGHEHLIRAAKFAGRGGRFWKVWIIGEGPLKQHLLDLWDFDEYSDVKILPRLPLPMLNYFYEQADVFVMPSVPDWRGLCEGLGLTALEALKKHRPLVGFPNGGLSELLDLQGVPAAKAEPHNHIGLASAVNRMVESEAHLINWERVDLSIAENYSEEACTLGQNQILVRLLKLDRRENHHDQTR